MTTEIAGIMLPDSPICIATTEYAKRVSAPFLFNHVMRSYVFGELAGQSGAKKYDSELLYIGSVLHDIGLTDDMPANERFEIEGADAAQVFLSQQGMDDKSIDIVWDAIALHTTFGIPQRKQPEIALVQAGAALDVGVMPIDMIPPDFLERILDAWPRLNFKNAIIEALGGMMKRNPNAAQSNVVSDIAERTIPDFPRFNICDAIHGSGFHE